MKPVCLVIGAGAGIGGSVAAKFAGGGKEQTEGYHTVLCRRSDKAGLDKICGEIKSAGGEASGVLLDATEPDAIENLINDAQQNIGPIEIILFNLGAQIGNRKLADTTPKMFELGWRMATFALFRTAQAALPAMAERGRGALLVTSATAAMRGNAGQASHAAAMGGRRMLCQSLNAEFAPQGIHIAHLVVDGAVDAPDTLGKMLGAENFARLREAKGDGKDGLLLPREMANTYWHIAHQHRSAWTHELDLRPYADVAWFNDNPTGSF